jgi:hypothetical protein
MDDAALPIPLFKALFLCVLLPDAAQYLFHRDGVIGIVVHSARLLARR